MNDPPIQKLLKKAIKRIKIKKKKEKMKRKKQCLLKRTRREGKEEAAKPIYCSTGRQETTISQRVFISIRIIPFPEMCLCQWNTTPRASTIPWAKSLEHEKG